MMDDAKLRIKWKRQPRLPDNDAKSGSGVWMFGHLHTPPSLLPDLIRLDTFHYLLLDPQFFLPFNNTSLASQLP